MDNNIATLETMFKFQGCNDDVVKLLNKETEKFIKLSKQLVDIKNKYNEDDFREDVKDILDNIGRILTARFGIVYSVRLGHTIATLPYINPNNLEEESFSFNVSSRTYNAAIKRMKKFYEWLKKNDLVLDLKKIYVENMPRDFYTIIILHPRPASKLEPVELTAAILHEVGHTFTLLEMYGRTTNFTQRLLDALINSSNDSELMEKLKISVNKEEIESDNIDKNLVIKIYKEVEKEFRDIILGSMKQIGFTDSEFEADEFVVKFCLGKELASALKKMSYMLLELLIFLISMKIILSTLWVCLWATFIFGGNFSYSFISSLRLSLFITAIFFILYLVNVMFKQLTHIEPSEDVHGTMSDRLLVIKTNLIKLLRTADLTKEEKRKIIADIEEVEKILNKLEHNVTNKIITSFIIQSDVLLPNLNIEKRLVFIVDFFINNELYVFSNMMSLLGDRNE